MTRDKALSRQQVLEQAAEWLFRQDESQSRDRQEWLSRSAENRRAYEDVEELVALVGNLDETPWPDESELQADTYSGDEALYDWVQKKKRREQQALKLSQRVARKGTVRWVEIGLSMAAALVVGVALVWWQLDTGLNESVPDVKIYRTITAQHRDITLSDGSQVSLGANSTMSIAYTEDQRLITLDQGEAYFVVKKIPGRPFMVDAGSRRVAAVGTAFNISEQQERVVVTVAEGQVIVAPALAAGQVKQVTEKGASDPNLNGSATFLNAGQQLIYDHQKILVTQQVDPNTVLAWRDGRLKYLSEKLRYVIANVNRYSRQPIRLTDSELGDYDFTGTVFHDNIDVWINSLEQAFPLRVERTKDGVILLSRRQ